MRSGLWVLCVVRLCVLKWSRAIRVIFLLKKRLLVYFRCLCGDRLGGVVKKVWTRREYQFIIMVNPGKEAWEGYPEETRAWFLLCDYEPVRFAVILKRV